MPPTHSHLRSPSKPSLDLADRLSREFHEALAAGDLEVPPLRQSVMQLLELCNRPSFEVHQVVDVVHTDPALAGHILRLANSAAFGAKQRIDSITEAVGRLGARQLQGVAAGLMLKADLFKGSVRLGTRLRHMWQHSALAGVYARDIGQLANLEPRAAMIIGLMHDVGSPFVLRQLIDLETLTGETLPGEVIDDVVHVLHAPIGAALVRAWGLSENLVAAAEFHHEWADAGEHSPSAMLAQVADEFAHWSAKPSAEGGRRLLASHAVAQLGLDHRMLGSLFLARDEVREVAQAL